VTDAIDATKRPCALSGLQAPPSILLLIGRWCRLAAEPRTAPTRSHAAGIGSPDDALALILGHGRQGAEGSVGYHLQAAK
jgi:hypothetical protein